MAETNHTPSIRDLPNARIVVVGDYLIDRWVHGRVERISPEAPVPVFVADMVEDRRPGGAGNVGANLAALGCYPTVLTNIGDSSPVKERYIAQGQQIFRVDREIIRPIHRQIANDLYLKATASPTIGALVLSDYGKGIFLGDLAARLIAWADQFKIPVIVDPKGDWRRYTGATVITPNEAELGDEDPDRLMPEFGFEAVLATRGSKGMVLHMRDNRWHIPAAAREVFDVTGAGDTVVAVLAAAVAVGFSLPEAAKLANAAAGVVVGKRGTATCSLEELKGAMS